MEINWKQLRANQIYIYRLLSIIIEVICHRPISLSILFLNLSKTKRPTLPTLCITENSNRAV